jgi:hypothetical protein
VNTEDHPYLLSALTIVLVMSVAIGGFFIVQEETGTEEGITFAFEFPMEDYQGLDVITQDFDEDCKYYHENLTKSERSEYREGEVQGSEINLEGAKKGVFYQFCEPINETSRYRSDVFAVYSQQGGVISPANIALWKDNNGSIKDIGNITLKSEGE